MVNTIYDAGKITKCELITFAKLLSPFAPHVAEEINSLLETKEYRNVFAEIGKSKEEIVELLK